MSPDTHPRPERPLAPTPLLSFDIAEQIVRLHGESGWAEGGRNAITLVKEDDLRVVLIALRKGVTLDEHHTTGPFTLQVSHGMILLRASEQSIQVSAGGLLVVRSAVPHEVEALDDSAFLLTIVQPPWSRATPRARRRTA